MTGFQDVAPEELAKLFFHYREALAPDFPYSPGSFGAASCWEAVQLNEQKLLVATARMVLLELANTAGAEDGRRDTNQTGTGRVEGSEGKECGC